MKQILSGIVGVIFMSSAVLAADPSAAPLMGSALFAKKCSQCHATGVGNPKMAGMLHVDPAKLNLTQSKLTAPEILALLKTGRNKMPIFKTLTEEQAQSLITYVIGLRSSK